MYPVLFPSSKIYFSSYVVMLCIAFLTCVFLGVRESRLRNEGFGFVPQTGLSIFIGALLGAKIYHYFQYPETHPDGLWRALIIWESGLVYYGGLIGGSIAAAIDLSIRRIPLIKAADVMVPFLALGEAITRIGCFLNGCCWGRTTTMPWGVRFPKRGWAYVHMKDVGLLDKTAITTPPLHPTQLYMTLGLMAVFVVSMIALRRKRFDGYVCLVYCLLYGLLRFVVECYRGDSVRSVFDMTVSQTISLGLVAFAVAMFAALRVRRRGRNRSAPNEENRPAAAP